MFELSSNGIVNGIIADKYGIRSAEEIQGVPQRSLPYSWKGAPKGTRSFAIVFQDYDNAEDEGVCWIHWLVADIPADIDALPENASRENAALIQGTNSWSVPYAPYADIDKDLTVHYGGPAPGRTHEYETTIYALDIMTDLPNGFYYNQLRRKMEGHILAESTLKGYYAV